MKKVCREDTIKYDGALFTPFDSRFLRFARRLGYNVDVLYAHFHDSALVFMVKTGKTRVECQTIQDLWKFMDQAVDFTSLFSLSTIARIVDEFRLGVRREATLTDEREALASRTTLLCRRRKQRDSNAPTFTTDGAGEPDTWFQFSDFF